MPTRVPKQESLFDNAAPAAPRIVETFDLKRPQNKAQASFQRLVKDIEVQRAELLVWQTYEGRYHQRVAQEIQPAITALRANRTAIAHALDTLLQKPKNGVTKRQRKQLVRMLVDLAMDLLQEAEDPALIDVHDRYSELSYAENQELGMAYSQEMIERITGIDLGEQHGAQNMEELFAKAEEELRRKDTEKQEKRARRKAKKAADKAEKTDGTAEVDTAKEITQSVREVYRKLASALHPDRETDIAERDRKTALMQRVNQAYEARDLLTLLNLQLEIEQIDTDHLNALSETRLAHYIEVLREQLAELKAEMLTVTTPFRAVVPHARKLSPLLVDAAINDERAHLQGRIDDLKDDLAGLGDAQYREQLLRHYMAERQPDLDEMMGLFGMVERDVDHPMPTKSSRKHR